MLVRLIRNALLGLAAAASLAACTASVAAPAGDPVVLTVTGAIDASNRGPLDDFSDGFLGHKNIKFDRAYEFTRSSLAVLGEHEVTIKRGNWPRAVKVRGPALKDVMAAVKAKGGTVVLEALDGYRSTFPIASLQSPSVLLAIEADGKPLSIGGLGPAWLVFPAGVVPGDDSKTDAGLAWSVFYIEVKD
jgi:hypothetical protein